MGAVMIKCPDTGHDIPTGIVADRRSFSTMPVFFGRVFCPLCRTEHEWFARDAWVCEAEPERAPSRGGGRAWATAIDRPSVRRRSCPDSAPARRA